MENELYPVYTQQYNAINGHGIWHYLIPTVIGNIHVIDYEGKGMEVTRIIIDEDNEKAEKQFAKISKRMINNQY